MPASKRPYPSQTIDNDNDPLERPSKRFATVYDAVAGRITQAGFIGHVTDEKSSKQLLRPDEVLFKQSNAPVRYEETDYYYAHTRLSPDQQLPSGDLLGAIHAYFSKLYSRTDERVSQKVWKCMDETALIAFGILMEETAREVLGSTGDLAFVEGANEEEEGTIQPVEDKEKKGGPKPTNIEEEQEVSDPSSINSSVFRSEESDSDGS